MTTKLCAECAKEFTPLFPEVVLCPPCFAVADLRLANHTLREAMTLNDAEWRVIEKNLRRHMGEQIAALERELATAQATIAERDTEVKRLLDRILNIEGAKVCQQDTRASDYV